MNVNTFYLDFARIRKHDGFVYWWKLFNYAKRTKTGKLSDKAYKQGDCKLFRYKILSDQYYREPNVQGD